MSEQAAIDNPKALNDSALELTQKPNSIFRRALLGGYKTQDVDHYVERAADVLESLIAENRDYKVRIDELEQAERAMRTTLSSTLKFSENIADAAKREATSLIQSTAGEAASDALSLAQEIEVLRAQRNRLAAELNATLDSHIRLLDAVESNGMPDSTRRKAQELLGGKP
jgi:cell division septum initiation protein DivIVA